MNFLSRIQFLYVKPKVGSEPLEKINDAFALLREGEESLIRAIVIP